MISRRDGKSRKSAPWLLKKISVLVCLRISLPVILLSGWSVSAFAAEIGLTPAFHGSSQDQEVENVASSDTKISGRKVTVFTESLAPLHFERDGQVVGIATELVQKIFAEAGLVPEFEVYPWNRAYLNVCRQKDSFIFTINRTAKREHDLKWIGPIMDKLTCLYKLSERSDIKVKNVDDVRRFTTAVLLGHSLTTHLRDLGFREGVELLTTNSKIMQMRLLLTGRVDLVTGNQYTMYSVLQQVGLPANSVEPALLMDDSSYYLAANLQTSDALVDRIRAANDRVQQKNPLPEIIGRYIHK